MVSTSATGGRKCNPNIIYFEKLVEMRDELAMETSVIRKAQSTMARIRTRTWRRRVNRLINSVPARPTAK